MSDGTRPALYSKSQDFKWLKLFMILVLIVGISSCKTGSKTGKVDTKNINAAYLTDQLLANQLDAEWFSAKAKINFEDDNIAVSGSASVKMRKDSVLWMSIKKLGLELARVQLTRDSVYIIDRFHSEYNITSLDYIEKRYNIPADFLSLQSMILGNPMLLPRVLKMEQSISENYHLSAKTKEVNSDYYIIPESFKLHKSAFAMDDNRRSLELNYGEFTEVNRKQIFPYLCKLDINSPETGPVIIEIKYSKVELNVPKSIQFEIPEKYTRTD